MRVGGREQPRRERAVVADHLPVAVGAGLLQGQPHLQRAEAARVLRTEVDVVRRRRRRRSGSRAGGTRTRAAARRRRAPAGSPPRAARRATCAGRRPPSRPGAARAGRGGASGSAAASAPYAPSTWNHAPASRQISAMASSGSTAPVLTEPAVPDDQHRHVAGVAIGVDRLAQRRDVEAQVGVGRESSGSASVPRPGEVGRLLDPGVRLADA